MSRHTRARAALRVLLLAGAAALPAPLLAQEAEDIETRLKRFEAQLEAQAQTVARQDEIIRAQAERITELEERVTDNVLAEQRGRGAVQVTQVAQAEEIPDTPVGEAPAEPEERAEIRAVPEGQGVLTPKGTLTLDPSIEYTRSSTNRLVFRGIELVPGIQIGLIEATDADRDTVAGTLAGRLGITDRLEAELRVPVIHRYDRIEVAQQRDEGIVREIALDGDNIGDVEFAMRYQFNRPIGQKPIFNGSVRVKSDTGKGPFEIGFDEFGVATELATGSGFWGVAPGINFLLPSDPIVIYGGTSYLFHLARDVNRTIGDAFIGNVDPGDVLSANVGFGFAINPRFSFSLGYRHNYVFKTRTEIADTIQFSKELQVGSLNLGMSYRATERDTLNLGFEFGVTEDAPDVSITVRAPYNLKIF